MPIVLDVKRGDYPKFSQATEDIKVYKVILLKGTRFKSMFYENYWNPIYKMKKIGIFTSLPGKTKSREYLISNEGLYSFNNLKDAQRFYNTYSEAKQFIGWTIAICGATIPEGAIYLQYKGQMISNELWLNQYEN